MHPFLSSIIFHQREPNLIFSNIIKYWIASNWWMKLRQILKIYTEKNNCIIMKVLFFFHPWFIVNSWCWICDKQTDRTSWFLELRKSCNFKFTPFIFNANIILWNQLFLTSTRFGAYCQAPWVMGWLQEITSEIRSLNTVATLPEAHTSSPTSFFRYSFWYASCEFACQSMKCFPKNIMAWLPRRCTKVIGSR